MSLLQLALNISNAIDDLYDHDEPVSEFAQFEAIYNELVSHDDHEPIDDDTDNFTTADPIPEPEGAYQSTLKMNWYNDLFRPKMSALELSTSLCPDGSQAAKGAK